MSKSGGERQTFPVVWADLPNPEQPHEHCELWLAQPSWEHIVQKHVYDPREPWGELLSGRTCNHLGGRAPLPGEAAGELIGRLGQQIRHSLERPLILRIHGQGASGRGRVWLAVVPCGALACVWTRGNRGFLKTCYFPRRACVERNRAHRWRRVVARLVWRYCRRQEEGRPVLALSSEGEVRPAPGASGATRRIRFILPSTWGFVEGPSGWYWRGRLGTWEPAETCAERSGRRHRLRARRRRGEGHE